MARAKIDEIKVKELYDQGLGYQKIARILNCSEWSVRMFVKESGFKSKKYTRFSEEECAKIKKLYIEDGMTYKEVAAATGHTEKEINSLLRRKRIRRGMHAQEIIPDEVFSNVKLHTIDDPIFYLEHTPTNERVSYHKKQYRDVSAMILGG